MTGTSHQPTRIAIVGAGNVGATFAYALLMSGLASEIVLIDQNQAKAEGEAMDLNHAMPLAQPVRVWAGSYVDCRGAAVTVITAGSPQKTGESRLDLVQRNAAIFQDIITMVVHYNPDGILLVATNPVDILTCITLHFSGFPPSRVIGSGTILDTARFRYLVSQEFGVDPRSVHAYIIGEHGDSEVPVWSLANVAGMHIPDFCAMNGYECNQGLLDSIFERTRDAAYQIIERKKATYYAIASGLLRIVEAVLRNQGSVLSVSSLIEDYYGIQDVCLSLPSVIDHTGVRRVIRLELDDAEIAGLRKSAEVLLGTMKQLNLDDHHVI